MEEGIFLLNILIKTNQQFMVLDPGKLSRDTVTHDPMCNTQLSNI